MTIFTSAILSRLRKPEAAGHDAGPPVAQAHSSRGLPRFLAGLSGREHPILLDLGPVVGANVVFFGGLGCKLIVEHLSNDVDRHEREGRAGELPAFFESRFPQETGSIDGILCWDVFDHLDRRAAEALARQLVRVLRPEGVILAFFNHSAPAGGEPPTYTRHAVVDRRTLEHRPYAAARARQRPMQNRDIQRMFEPLAITDQFLQKTNVREIVMRKPAASGT